jgi:hypothetical protein
MVIDLPAKDMSSAASEGLAPATAAQMASEMSDPFMASLRRILPDYHYARRNESEAQQWELLYYIRASISPLSKNLLFAEMEGSSQKAGGVLSLRPPGERIALDRFNEPSFTTHR